MCSICRSWDKVYVVLNGNLLSCYKDKKIAKQVRSLSGTWTEQLIHLWDGITKGLISWEDNMNGEVQQQRFYNNFHNILTNVLTESERCKQKLYFVFARILVVWFTMNSQSICQEPCVAGPLTTPNVLMCSDSSSPTEENIYSMQRMT